MMNKMTKEIFKQNSNSNLNNGFQIKTKTLEIQCESSLITVINPYFTL